VFTILQENPWPLEKPNAFITFVTGKTESNSPDNLFSSHAICSGAGVIDIMSKILQRHFTDDRISIKDLADMHQFDSVWMVDTCKS
jgi:hypothetical protein